jgi:DNA-binding transcriptional regulator YiaG
MARISKYENEWTELSKQYGEKFREDALKLTLEDIEALQMKYGISDAELSNILEINRMVVSHWKTRKRELPKYYLFNIYAFFQYLEKKYNKK